MTTDIRPIDPTHPQALACLHAYYDELNATFPQGFDPGPVDEAGMTQLRPPLGVFLLAWAGEQPIGCVGLRGDGTPTAEVKRLWVAPAARRAGLAQELMQAVVAHAHQTGHQRLVLDTSAHLPKAVAFYRRHGWTEIRRYNDNPYAHHFFELRLS